VVGQLATKISEAGFRQIETAAVESWTDEIETIKTQLANLCRLKPQAKQWGILFEFTIPRRQQRIDVVLLAGGLILAFEFKSVGSAGSVSSVRQVEDYGLDLSYFHSPSHGRVILPILVGPGLRRKTPEKKDDSNVRSVGTVAPEELALMLNSVIDSEPSSSDAQIDLQAWNNGAYEPVPTIIEAAMSLYAGMSVREITHSRATASDITATTTLVLHAIVKAQDQHEKVICFVTGVPGAGKTLVGMNIAHSPGIRGNDRPGSVFMSGNGPLVKILREALARDASVRNGTPITKERKTVAFVQNIHNYVKQHLLETQSPYEQAIVFDEAQRAWSADQNKRKHRNKSADWHTSEPEMVLKIMDRHEGGAAIVALVGGGQEINEGEAGIAEWGKALRAKFSHWKVLASPEALRGGESVAGASLFERALPTNVIIEEKALHLRTSNRSHQATELAAWVNRVLAGDAAGARTLSRTFEQFPIFLSRSLEETNIWLRNATRGERRCGLIASSGAARLRPEGLEMSLGFRQSYPFDRWFLDSSEDIRSSYQLEVAASEFEIQGLELDYVGLCWGGDFIWDRNRNTWRPLKFTGSKWNRIKDAERALRVTNRYRVLLTRAREGLVIWVPKGDQSDATRSVQAMNDTAEYLLSCGVIPLPIRQLQQAKPAGAIF
jgi:hypothetical protein